MDYNPNQTLVPVIASSGATATFAGEIYSQFQSLTGTFSKWTNSNVLEDGDNFAPPPAHLYVPEGYFAKVTSILKVDDWGKITIVPVNSAAGINNITALNMTNEIEPAGVRGGHVRWQKTSTILLPAGMYNIIVRQDNAKYKDEYEAEASSNQSFCEVSINIVYDTVPNVICPLLINAVLSKYQGAGEDERTDSESALENSSYCASGFMYRGYIDVYYSNGTIKRIPAQSGGWINKSESPFKAPKDKNNYNRFEWPDTACPTCLTTPANKDYPGINPEASGNTNGYTISIDEAASQAQIQGAGCGRTHIKLHLAKRIGSEGCISTIEWYDAGIQGAARTSYENNPLWYELVDAMVNATAKLRNPIPFTIQYVGEQPNYNRIPPGAEYYQNLDLSNLNS